MAIEIVDWNKHYENNRTREMKHMGWVPLPINLSGDGYTELVDHPNGAAHFGAWCALLEVAGRCGERGTLLRDNAAPHDEASLARITRIPAQIWSEVLPRLLSIGWIRGYEIPQEGAGIPQATDEEQNRIEQKGIERKVRKNSAAVAAIVKDTPFYHRIQEGFLKRNGDKFTDYGKEGKAIHGLMEKAQARDAENAEDLLVSVCSAFWKLKTSGDKFWSSQPFLPSALNSSSIWDRVLESMRVDEVDPEILAIIKAAPR